VFSDLKTPITNNGQTVTGYEVAIIQNSDYSPFGVELDGRSSVGSYRYGFQGQEMDDEVKGDGNAVNYKFRMHDPRLGRFFAVDPLASKYPHNSVYAFSENRVLDGLELEGLEYVTFNIEVRNGKVMNIETVKDYDLKNPGTFGAGTLKNYVYKNEDGSINKIISQKKENGWQDYGIYGGKNNLFMPSKGDDIGDKPNKNNERKYLGVEPIDEIDQKWQKHDDAFNNVKCDGAFDTFFNRKTQNANEEVLKDIKEVLAKVKNDECDAVTNKDYSKEGVSFMKVQASILFNAATKCQRILFGTPNTNEVKEEKKEKDAPKN
jgi:RHS repeat-associated protein